MPSSYTALSPTVSTKRVASVGDMDETGSVDLILENDEHVTVNVKPVAGDYYVTQSDNYNYLDRKAAFEHKFAPA